MQLNKHFIKKIGVGAAAALSTLAGSVYATVPLKPPRRWIPPAPMSAPSAGRCSP